MRHTALVIAVMVAACQGDIVVEPFDDSATTDTSGADVSAAQDVDGQAPPDTGPQQDGAADVPEPRAPLTPVPGLSLVSTRGARSSTAHTLELVIGRPLPTGSTSSPNFRLHLTPIGL